VITLLCGCVVARVSMYPLSLLGNGSVSKNSPIVARQRLRRNVTAVTNTHASTWPVSYQGK
jgi:hypothetical protein